MQAGRHHRPFYLISQSVTAGNCNSHSDWCFAILQHPVKRSFQSSWFANRTWLHYDEANDLAFCHVCMIAHRDGKLNSATLDAFILNGFSTGKMLA